MSKKKLSYLEKIGYQKSLPKNADIDNYESIIITQKDGIKIKLYRLSSLKETFDDTTNFNNSWNIFNSYLNH